MKVQHIIIRSRSNKRNKWLIFSLMERHMIGLYNYVSANNEKVKRENTSLITDSTDDVCNILGDTKLKELFKIYATDILDFVNETVADTSPTKEKIIKDVYDIAQQLHVIIPKYSVDEWNKHIQNYLGYLDKIKDIVSQNIDTLYILYDALRKIDALSRMMVL